MAVQQETYTVEEYLEIVQSPENQDKRYELVNGAIVEMPSSSPLNAIIAQKIGLRFGLHVEENKLGFVTIADGTYRLGPNNAVVPDVAFISISRVQEIPTKYFDGAPDLAVEVISPSETAQDVRNKVWAYLQGGARLVWAVYPKLKIVDVYRLASENHLEVEQLGIDDMLDGKDVLPGFTLPVKNIFPDQPLAKK